MNARIVRPAQLSRSPVTIRVDGEPIMALAGDTILEVGPTEALRSRYPGVEEISSARMAPIRSSSSIISVKIGFMTYTNWFLFK